MKDKNDQLISKFMQTNKHDIADNGFSKKVINKLPKPFLHTSEIVNALGWIAAFYLLFYLNTWEILFKVIDNWVATLSYDLLSSGNLLSVIAVVGVLIALGVQKACATK